MTNWAKMFANLATFALRLASFQTLLATNFSGVIGHSFASCSCSQSLAGASVGLSPVPKYSQAARSSRSTKQGPGGSEEIKKNEEKNNETE